jgi:hypothetical protein
VTPDQHHDHDLTTLPGCAAALAGLGAALATHPGGSEVVVEHQPRRGDYRAIVRLGSLRDGPNPSDRGLPGPSRRFDGYGRTMELALVDLWSGQLGVWRFLDPEAWAAAQVRLPATNPGPLAGQHLGRSDG